MPSRANSVPTVTDAEVKAFFDGVTTRFRESLAASMERQRSTRAANLFDDPFIEREDEYPSPYELDENDEEE